MAFSSPAGVRSPTGNSDGAPTTPGGSTLTSPVVSPGGTARPGGRTASAAAQPPIRGFWEELRYSHSFWGYAYRLGAAPPSNRTQR